EGQGTTKIVKFFVFSGGSGGRDAPRQGGADLDGFGVKFVPNLCNNCHGGNYSPNNPASPTFAEINMLASFRELDLETFLFPGGRTTATSAEQDRFRQQNQLVGSAGTISVQAIKDLITNWYAAGP